MVQEDFLNDNISDFLNELVSNICNFLILTDFPMNKSNNSKKKLEDFQ